MIPLPPVAPMIIDYPDIDPVLVEIGPFPVRWYALAYFFGILLAYFYMRRLAVRVDAPVTRTHLDDFILWATLGVIGGGRLGYVLFYAPGRFLQDPLQILALWDGGMSFHGGFLGIAVATLLFCRANAIPLLRFADLLACAAPIGLFLGRLANFVNGELWGRPSDAPWAMIFPRDPAEVPRHPSQLYEAALEGLVLFAVLGALAFFTPLARRRPGLLTGAFMAGYGLARFAVEFFREPDAHLKGLAQAFMSMGQILSLPMIAAGAAFIGYALTRRATPRPGRAASR